VIAGIDESLLAQALYQEQLVQVLREFLGCGEVIPALACANG
jgi:hypothetical protein